MASTQLKWTVGICAMESKAQSKPMKSIVKKITASGLFEVVFFSDAVILEQDIKEWPLCDFLISFYSNAFPLQKAINYVKLRQPVCVNDVEMQQILMDRRCVLKILDTVGVQTPRRFLSQREDTPELSSELIAQVKKSLNLDLSSNGFPVNPVKQVNEDTIEWNGQMMKKPFVEKPVSGEDHNIRIYYPQSAGGGARCLFRKVASSIGDKSSDFDASLTDIRTDSSYIYEEFIQVDNAEDVKVYTVGSSFAHAERRKSPVVDGIVSRNKDGKELRYITELSPEEQDMALKVGQAFGQFVCGFDVLRVQGQSYIIDVNGWSFVKGDVAYNERCAELLSALFQEEASKRNLVPVHSRKE